MNYEPFKLYLLNNENNISKIISYSTQEGNEEIQYEGVVSESQKTNIYKDDVIENVKFKLISQLSDKNIENYYFFVKRKIKINVRELLNNNKQPDGYIHYRTFLCILKNFNLKYDDYDKQDDYSIEYLNEKMGEYIDGYVNIPLGVDYNTYHHEFVVNPLENPFHYTFLSVGEKNSELFFEYGDIKENIVYCLPVKEYLAYVETQDMLSVEDTMNIYFKSLHSKKIFSSDDLDTSDKGLADKYENYNKLINTHMSFFENYSDKISEDIRNNTKITNIEFTYKPKSSIIFPLEIFFRKLQCNESMPLAKFNPGRGLENVYRLFCPNKDKYGNKIPFFPIDEIKKYKQKIKKEKSVSLIVVDKKKDNRKTLFHVNSDGEIYCSFENLDSDNYDIHDYDRLTKYSANILNKLLSLFIKYFDPTSLVYNEFDNIKEENIKIIEIQYSGSLKKRSHKLDTKYFPGIFTKIPKNSKKLDTKKDIASTLNYKRVSNYDRLSDIDATITKLVKINTDYEDILEQCMELSANKDKEEMHKYIKNFLKSIEETDHLSEGGKKKRYKELLHNTGFEIDFKKTNERNIVAFDVKLVNKFEYIDSILLFLNNFLLINCKLVESSEIKNYFGEFDAVDDLTMDLIVKDDKNKQKKPVNNDDKINANKKNRFDNYEKMLGKLLVNGDGYDNEEEDSEEDSEEEESEEEQLEKEQVEEEQDELQKDKKEKPTFFPNNDLTDYSEEEEEEEESLKESVKKNISSPSQPSVLSNQNVPENKEKPTFFPNNDFTDYSEEEESEEEQADEEESEEEQDEVQNDNKEEQDEVQNDKKEKPTFFSNNDFTDYSKEEEEEEEEEEESLKEPVKKNISPPPQPSVLSNQNVPENKEEQEEEEESDNNPGVVEQSDDESEDLEADANSNGYNSFNNQQGGGEPVKLSGQGRLLSNRLKQYQPNLFTPQGEKKGDGYLSYARACQTAQKRQPVIITEEEKNEIDEKYPGSYDKIIKYGSNPKKEQFYYLCPKYWNFKEWAPVKEEDVDPDLLIPEGTKEVDLDKGKHIYQITDDKTIPGFMETESQKFGYYRPCCFGMADGTEHKERVKLAEEQMRMLEDSNIDDDEDLKKFLKNKKPQNKQTIHQYQKDGRGKLSIGRFGSLPLSIEAFLGMSHQSDKCFNKKGVCLLRAGIRNDEKKSFLFTLAYLMNPENNKDPLGFVIKKIKEKVTIDNILNFHNGNIPSIFYNKNSSLINTSKYRKFKITVKYKNAGMHDKLQKLINGYENFINYLEDPNEKVDYYYLWDIISSGILFSKDKKSHINLIILKNNNDDITNNVSIICPSSSHSNFSYNEHNGTVIIYQNFNKFEPIIMTKKISSKSLPEIKTIFESKDIKEHFGMHMFGIMQTIMANISRKCSLSEKDKTINYEYQDNISFKELINIYDIMSKYNIHTQIMNFDDKIIAVLASDKESDDEKFYVPIKPSPRHEEYEFVIINDTYWRNYAKTKQFLLKFYNDSNKQVQCLPIFKITENGMVVGLLTSSNQFVKIDPPEEIRNVQDEIPEYYSPQYNGYVYSDVDKILSQHGEIDKTREELTKSLMIEAELYNTYVNTMKHLLSENLNKKQAIREILKNENFEKGYEELYAILEGITEENFIFVLDKDDMFLGLEQINLCHVVEEGNAEYCETEEEITKMLIPETNLYTKEDNKTKYISSLTFDLLKNEIVRYNVLDSLLNVFNFQVSYTITKTEIILLEKFLLKYFEKLGDKKSKYALQDVFEDMKPQDVINYLEIQDFEFNDKNNVIQGIEEEEEKADEEKRQKADEEVDEEKGQKADEEPEEEEGQKADEEAEEEEGQKAHEEAEEEGQKAHEEDEKPDETVEEVEEDEKDEEEEEEDEEDEEEYEGQDFPMSIARNIEYDQNGDPIGTEETKEYEEDFNKKNFLPVFDKSELNEKSKEHEQNRNMHKISEMYEEANRLSENNMKRLNKLEKEPEEELSVAPAEVEPLAAAEESNSNSGIEYSMNKLPIKNTIIRLPKKTNKIKLKIKEGIENTINNVSYDGPTKEEKDELYKSFYHSQCVKPKYLTEYWRSIFPQRTKWLVFDKQINKCNFNILIFILKSHNFKQFENVTIDTIKRNLINYYNQLVFNCKIPSSRQKEKRCVQMLERKWRKEGKGFIDLKKTPIDTIINNESYVITVIDIMIYSYMNHIPIVVYYESKGVVKLSNYEKNNTKGFYYFVYYSSRTNDLYLTTRANSLRFELENLGSKITTPLKEKSFKNFHSYLFSAF